MSTDLISVAENASAPGTPCAKPEHEAFAIALAEHGNRSAAYRQVYPQAGENHAALKASASRLAQHPDVQRRVAELEQQRRERILNADLELLVANLTTGKATRLFDEQGNPIPVHLLPKDVQDAIAGLKLKVTRDKAGNTSTEYDVKLVDPLAALRLLAQLRGALVERQDITSGGKPMPAADQLTTPEAVRERIRAALQGRVIDGTATEVAAPPEDGSDLI